MFMTDHQIVQELIAGNQRMIEHFFFVRLRPALVYIGQYFCLTKQTPEELIGEFYEYLSANDWHKLKIFKYTCSLNSYVSIIASRYFQHKRDKEMVSIDENPGIVRGIEDKDSSDGFFMSDLSRAMEKMQPIDRFLLQRILIDGEKPRDILGEVLEFVKTDPTIVTAADGQKEFAGYVYTRYNRARVSLQRKMQALGYGG